MITDFLIASSTLVVNNTITSRFATNVEDAIRKFATIPLQSQGMFTTNVEDAIRKSVTIPLQSQCMFTTNVEDAIRKFVIISLQSQGRFLVIIMIW
jgi:hypothetical protein